LFINFSILTNGEGTVR